MEKLKLIREKTEDKKINSDSFWVGERERKQVRLIQSRSRQLVHSLEG